MTEVSGTTRFAVGDPPVHLRRPVVCLQPVLAKRGETNIDLPALAKAIQGVGALADTVAIESPEHWSQAIGDLIIKGGRDVPCLAQTLLREDGYIASCDGDFLAMMGMVLTTFFLDKTCMMSNMYPVEYTGALKDHFGDPLSPDPAKHPRDTWKNLARLGHCGFVGVVSPEMDPGGKTDLHDWGGTYEIKRDGRGCGNAGELAAGERIAALQLRFDGRTLLVADAEVCETTHHPGMPHCEKTALLRFRDPEGFVGNISREHSVVVYGDHVRDFEVLAGVLGLKALVF